jgi:hypothetical protein
MKNMLSVIKKIERYFWDISLIMFVFILFYYASISPAVIAANRETFIKFADTILFMIEKYGDNKAVLGYFFFFICGFISVSFWMISSIFHVTWKMMDDKEADAGPIMKLFFWIKKRRTMEV